MTRNRTTIVAVTVLALSCTASAFAGWRHHTVRPNLRIVLGPQKAVESVVIVEGSPSAAIDFNVSPRATRIFVDGSYRGTCDEFDGFPQKMRLEPGRHIVRLVTPDGTSISRSVQLIAGYEFELNLEL